MSAFHDEFYTNCSLHNIEHPKWKKCSKCEEKIIYSEEEVLELLNDFFYDHINAQNANIKLWFNKNKKK